MIKTLAFDFGASSGRAILGLYDGKTLNLEETHRFSNDPVQIGNSLHWDVLRLFHEIKQGIVQTVHQGHRDIASIGIDTWGVDFGLLDQQGNLLGNPYHYRDTRTEGMMEKACEMVGRNEIFAQTGIEIIWFNTLYQLMAMAQQGSAILEKADTMLMMPDLFNYFLTGVKSAEYTNSTTTQMYNASKGEWARDLMKQLGIPSDLYLEVVKPGTKIGTLLPEISKELGVSEIPVISVASHDTASAAVSVPVTDEEGYAFISCGTWSIMGAEIDKPLINDRTMKLNFTNEGGTGGKVLLMKNIMGLWLIQECRRQWAIDGQKLSFNDLEQAAREAKPFVSFIDPDDMLFAGPNNMPSKVQEFCRRTGQAVPETKGEIIRCIAQSLALKYRYTVECLEEIQGKKISRIHLVGGGIKDRLICSFTANATKREVIAGPVEATAIGNNLVQLMALGELKDLCEARQLVCDSFETVVYTADSDLDWDAAYEIFRKYIGTSC